MIAYNFFSTFPNARSWKILVTDGEKAIINAFKPYVTSGGGFWVPCFIHKSQDLMIKCKELKIDGDYFRTAVFGRTKETLDGMVDETEEEFQNSVDEAENNWPPALYQWFKNCLYDDIKEFMLPSQREKMGLPADATGKLTSG